MDEVHSLKGLTMKDLIRHAAELKQQLAAFKQPEVTFRLVYDQLEIQVHEHSRYGTVDLNLGSSNAQTGKGSPRGEKDIF